MNKNIMIIAAVIIVILLGVGGFMLLGKKKSAPTTSPSAAMTKPTDSSMIASIQAAIAGGASLECDFTDAQGKNIKSAIKGGMVRADITSSDAKESGSVIIKDKKMYFWNAQTAMTMDIPDVSITPSAGQAGASQQADLMNSMEQYKQYCHQAAVADAEFTPPANIKFQDMSGAMKAMPSVPAQSGMTQSQMEEMMKKYLTPTP